MEKAFHFISYARPIVYHLETSKLNDEVGHMLVLDYRNQVMKKAVHNSFGKP